MFYQSKNGQFSVFAQKPDLVKLDMSGVEDMCGLILANQIVNLPKA